MKKRLTKIYTRAGDDGTTRLGNGQQIEKNNPRVVAYGTVDELNAHIGAILSEDFPEEVRTILIPIQHMLFDVGGELCIPGRSVIGEEDVVRLERDLDRLNEHLEPLAEFIIPGGARAAAQCHIARTVCRRAERDLVTLSANETVSAPTLKYLNRLSDLLFVIARYVNRKAGVLDCLWKSDQKDD